MKALSLFGFLLSLTAFGQVEPVTSMFWNTNEYYNPATTGMDYKHRAIVHHRNEWSNGYGNTSTVGSYGMKSDKLHGGIGVNGMFQSSGMAAQTSKANVNYSYHLKLGESTLGIGAQAGIANVSTKQIYYFIAPDEAIVQPAGKTTNFNAATGIFYKWRKLSFGASVTQIMKVKNAHYRMAPNYWLTAAYEIKISDKFQLTPSILYNSDGAYQSLNANVRATLFEKLWLGASACNRDSYAFMAGYDFAGKFRIGYAYEQTVSRLNNGMSAGTHEVVLGFLLK